MAPAAYGSDGPIPVSSAHQLDIANKQQNDGDIGVRGMKNGMLTSLQQRFAKI